MSVVAPGARFDCSEAVRALVIRQAQSWVTGELAEALPDWHPDGVLTAPAGRFPLATIPAAMAEFHALYVDLEIGITNVFANADGTRVAIEWLWTVSRRADGERSVTEDAIIADLVDGKILSWREYFDTATAVEDPGASALSGAS